MHRRAVALVVAGILAPAAPMAAQTPDAPMAGAALYGAWCSSCHGTDVRGRSGTPSVSNIPPDFTNCSRTTRATDADWSFVIAHGGAAVGGSPDMPAFEALSPTEVAALVATLRDFCRDSRWPAGNLNFPRALFTERAFPQDEIVFQPIVSHSPDAYAHVRGELSYTRRVGPRAALEARLPVETAAFSTGRHAGFGDVGLEGTYVVAAPSGPRRMILTAGLDVTLASGNPRWGFGDGTTTFQPFVAAGTSRDGLLIQGDVRALLPMRPLSDESSPHVEYHAAILRPLGSGPLAWTIGGEISGLGSGVSATPEVIKTLSPTGPWSLGLGVEFPLRPTPPRTRGTTRWSAYLAWNDRARVRSRR